MQNKVMVFEYPGKYVSANRDLNGISRKKIMENEFRVFTLNGNDFRVIKGLNGNPLWFAKDICTYFGVTDHNPCVSKIGADMKKLVSITDLMGRTHKDTIVNQPGVFTLIFECRPKKIGRNGGAERDIALTEHCKKMVEFQHWVRDTVFPAILTFPEKLRAYADQLEWRERFDKQQMVAEKQHAVAAPKRRSSVACH
jgi:prophage antirepressor-like protein